MKLFKKSVLGILFSIIAINTYAQFGRGKIEEIEAVQKRKLIVILEEPRESVIKKLTKKKKDSELDNYKAAVDEYNAEMKEVVEKYWPYKENGFEYKTYKQVQALKKAKNTKFAVLYCISQRPSTFSSGYASAEGLSWTWNIKEDSEDRDYFDYFTTMVVNQIEDFESTPIYSTPLPDIFPTKASLVFGINNTKSYFDYRIRKKKNGEKINQQEVADNQVKENAPKLKDMTLLIRKDLLNKELPEASIGTYYGYKFKVATKEEVDNAIMSQQEQTGYIVILPTVVSNSNTNYIIYMQFIYDAKTNELMAYIRPSTLSMMGAAQIGGKAGKKTIEKNNLEKFTKIINGKD